MCSWRWTSRCEEVSVFLPHISWLHLENIQVHKQLITTKKIIKCVAVGGIGKALHWRTYGSIHAVV